MKGHPLTGAWSVRSLGLRRISVISLFATLLILITCTPMAYPVSAASTVSQTSTATTSTSSSGLNMTQLLVLNKPLFLGTVPAYAVIGVNYTLKIEILNNANRTVPVVLRVDVPVNAIFVHPQVIRAEIPPNGTLEANFTMVPFGHPQAGPFDVTLLLYVFFPDAMTSPVLVDQAIGVVATIAPNQFPYLAIVLASAAAITLILVVVFSPEIFHRKTGRISVELRQAAAWSGSRR